MTVDPDSGRIRWDLLSPILGTDESDGGRYTVTVRAVDKAGNQLNRLCHLFTITVRRHLFR